MLVDVLGHAPSVGDQLVAYAIGGRWVAERGGSGGGTVSCEPCGIPETDLTLSWTNILIGPGSTTLVYNPSIGTGLWASACTNGLLFQLGCIGGQIELRVIFFTSGECPTGASNYCSNLRSDPLALTLASYTCSPFSLTFTLTDTSCPSILGDGYTSFTITP